MIEAYFSYLLGHGHLFAQATLEHIGIVTVTLVISILLSAVLSWLILQAKWLEDILVQLFSGIYAIPSMALFAMLIPITGLGNGTAIIVLTVYNQYLLLKNILAGIHGIDPAVVEAGRGMGMSELQILRRIQLPLAAPVIAAGLRLAILSTTGIAAIAACIQAGGLGVILFSGMRTMNVYKMVWGTIICVLLVFLEDGILRILQRKICKEVH